MPILTRIPGWLLFLLLVITFCSGYFIIHLLGVFLVLYWIISTGEFGYSLIENSRPGIYKIFYLSSRFIFILLAFACFLVFKNPPAIFSLTTETLLILTLSIIGVLILFITLYSANMLNKLLKPVPAPIDIFITAGLFICFPVGIWILQPKINKIIGENL